MNSRDQGPSSSTALLSLSLAAWFWTVCTRSNTPRGRPAQQFSVVHCGFNRSTQRIGQSVLSAFRSQAFLRVARSVVARLRWGWRRRAPGSARSSRTPGGYYSNIEYERPNAEAGSYGPAYPRLQKVKAQYDPRNLFRLNNNVQPAA
jgi:hypothetical protein